MRQQMRAHELKHVLNHAKVLVDVDYDAWICHHYHTICKDIRWSPGANHPIPCRDFIATREQLHTSGQVLKWVNPSDCNQCCHVNRCCVETTWWLAPVATLHEWKKWARQCVATCLCRREGWGRSANLPFCFLKKKELDYSTLSWNSPTLTWA